MDIARAPGKPRRPGDALLAELKAENPTGGWWPQLLNRFDDPDVLAALHAAYWIGYEDGESEARAYPNDD